MDNSYVSLVHLTDELSKVREIICVDLEIVEACAPSRIDINSTDRDVSLPVSIDKIGHVLLILIESIQPDPVIVCPFGVRCTLQIISRRYQIFGGYTSGKDISYYQQYYRLKQHYNII